MPRRAEVSSAERASCVPDRTRRIPMRFSATYPKPLQGAALGAAILLLLATPATAGSSKTDDLLTEGPEDPGPGPQIESSHAGSPGVDSPPPREVLLPDIPAREIKLGDVFNKVPSYDRDLIAIGMPDGQATVLVLEDFQFQTLYSSNGGATWSSEVVISGGPGSGGTSSGDVYFDGAGSLYAAMDMADPDGSCGMQFFRSDDMGQTWTNAVDLVRQGDDTHGVLMIRAAANASGRVAVAYVDGWGSDPYARVSSDRGVTWTSRVRLDASITEGTAEMLGMALAVDDSGVVHVAYSQDRGLDGRIFYTRSTDGGVTFETDRDLSAETPGPYTGSQNPQIAFASDGSLLIAFWDTYATDRLYVLRSVNGGDSFSTTLNRALSDTNSGGYLWIETDPATPTLLVAVLESTGLLSVQRSPDNGVSFGAGQAITSNAVDYSMTRTQTGSFGVAWIDNGVAAYPGSFNDVYARVSTDDGVSWGSETRVDGGTPGGANNLAARIAGVSSDDLIVTYRDTRLSDGSDYDVFANRSTADPLDFTLNEQRIDTDRGQRGVFQYNRPNVAADGANHVYVGAMAIADGPYADIYVTASSDGGYTFGTPQRISDGTPGGLHSYTPQVVTTSDGHVYAAYKRSRTDGLRDLRVNSSSDYGATWQSTDVRLGYIYNSSTFANNPSFQLAAVPGGTIHAIWSDGTNVWVATSGDGGLNYTTLELDGDASGNYDQPSICAQGNQVVAVFKGAGTIWGRVSLDGGTSWLPRTDLRGLAGGGQSHQPFVSCNGVSNALAIWIDSRDTYYRVYSSRLISSGWKPPVPVGDPMSWNGQYYPKSTFTSETDVVVVYHQYEDAVDPYDLSIYSVASPDAGATFGTPIRLDTGLRAGTWSVWPHLSSDGLDNVWVTWEEHSSFSPTMAVRHSGDGGQSYGPVRRIAVEPPQGFYYNDRSAWGGHGYGAANPGEGYFVWGGQRDTHWRDAVFNAYDLNDFDRDQSVVGVDCNDEDSGAFAAPVLVAGVSFEKVTGETRLSWTSQGPTAGSGTQYDVVTGTLQGLMADGDYRAATCLVGDWPEAYVDDARTPGSNDGYYYLISAKNSCGVGTFGDSSITPDPRDALDASPPCP
jgi:hypothetical protein